MRIYPFGLGRCSSLCLYVFLVVDGLAPVVLTGIERAFRCRRLQVLRLPGLRRAFRSRFGRGLVVGRLVIAVSWPWLWWCLPDESLIE